MTTFTIGEFSEMTGVNIKTLQLWDNNGKLPAYRTDTGRRYYTMDQYQKFVDDHPKIAKKAAIYTRGYGPYSDRNQARQSKSCHKYALEHNFEICKEYVDHAPGSTMSRPGLLELIKDCHNGLVTSIIIEAPQVLSTVGLSGMVQMFQSSFDVRIIFLSRRMLHDTFLCLEDIFAAVFDIVPNISAARYILDDIDKMQHDIAASLPEPEDVILSEWLTRTHAMLRNIRYSQESINRAMASSSNIDPPIIDIAGTDPEKNAKPNRELPEIQCFNLIDPGK